MAEEPQYTVTGRRCGRTWLVHVEPRRSRVYPPDAWGADEAHGGRWYNPGRGAWVKGSPWLAGWRIRRRVARADRREHREFRRAARAIRYADRQASRG